MLYNKNNFLAVEIVDKNSSRIFFSLLPNGSMCTDRYSLIEIINKNNIDIEDYPVTGKKLKNITEPITTNDIERIAPIIKAIKPNKDLPITALASIDEDNNVVYTDLMSTGTYSGLSPETEMPRYKEIIPETKETVRLDVKKLKKLITTIEKMGAETIDIGLHDRILKAETIIPGQEITALLMGMTK